MFWHFSGVEAEMLTGQKFLKKVPVDFKIYTHYSGCWPAGRYLEDGLLGLGSVVRITSIYKPLYVAHLEGVFQPDP